MNQFSNIKAYSGVGGKINTSLYSKYNKNNKNKLTLVNDRTRT